MAIDFGKLNIKKIRLDSIYNLYLGMNPKEQTIALSIVGIVLILILVLPITIASSRISKLDAQVEDGNSQLRGIMREVESYDRKKMELDQLQKMIIGSFDSAISSTLESIAEDKGMKDKIDALKERPTSPSEIFDEASADVRLRRVTLKQLVDFLYAIENNKSSMLRLKKLSIKTRFDNKRLLDVSFTVSTYRLLEGV